MTPPAHEPENGKSDLTPLALHIWQEKYRLSESEEQDILQSWDRVAAAVSSIEVTERGTWQHRFRELLDGFQFLPGGRILAGAGSPHEVTLLNCFVMGEIEDSLDGIFSALHEGALTMQQGGGVGYDFSTLRPAGVPARRVGSIASGPVSFMRIWDAMCQTLTSGGNRRGAMMGTLRCDHPDIEDFIDAKQQAGELTHFNLSVQVSDAFMAAVQQDAEWPLVFPEQRLPESPSEQEIIRREWGGESQTCRVFRRVSARYLWQKIIQASYDCAEPGVLFVDQINRENNLSYRERLTTTNPCGEIPLPPYGACDLGSFNLTCFVEHPFDQDACFNWEALRTQIPTAVRFLDNVLELSHYPLPLQAQSAKRTRRIGLGITGLADALLMLGIRYGDKASLEFASKLVALLSQEAYRASIQLAQEKGHFEDFDAVAYSDSAYIQRLPEDIRADIRQYGMRNSHLLAIAPTGTISLLANNVSSGIEPIYQSEFQRHIRDEQGQWNTFLIRDYACRLWNESGQDGLPPAFTHAAEISPKTHLEMQATLQPYVDNAISKTINVSRDIPFQEFQAIYDEAFKLRLKGCTVYRPNEIRGEILSEPSGSLRCCTIDHHE